MQAFVRAVGTSIELSKMPRDKVSICSVWPGPSIPTMLLNAGIEAQ